MNITSDTLNDAFRQLGLASTVLSAHYLGDGLVPWPPAPDSYLEDPIYLVPAEVARTLDRKDVDGIALAVFSPSWPPTIGQPAGASTIVACQYRGTADELLNRTREVLARFETFYTRMSNAVGETRPVQDLCQIASDFLHLPVVVTDRHLAMLARSTVRPRGRSSLWEALTSEETMVGREELQTLERRALTHFEGSNMPFTFGDASGAQVLCCSVFYLYSTLGCLFVFLERSSYIGATTEYCTQFALQIAMRLTIGRALETMPGMRAEELFSATLNGSVESAEALERHARAAHLRFGPRFQLAVFGTPGDRPSKTFLQRLAIQCRGNAPDATLVIAARECIVCLFCSTQEEAITSRAKEALERFARGNYLHVGISRSYHRFVESSRMFDQALAAVELGLVRRPEGTLFEFSDFTFPYLREILSARENLRTFCHPGLLQLEEHDREHGTELVHTVETYLECCCSPSHAAAALNIHRSTLDYRLRCAERVMDASLGDADVRFDVWLSLRLLRE